MFLPSWFQLVFGGAIVTAEYVIIEANCTGSECVPLDNAVSKAINQSFSENYS